MVPSFSFMGGKARLRKWLCSLFPKEGNLYLEPFAGLGNVFYSARTELNFQFWQINDLDVSFFNSILEVDLEALPNEVLKEDFLFWKEQNNSVSRVIEPRISFAGKGYKYGYNGTSGTHKGYNGVLYRNKCHQAKLLLQDVNITNLSWDELGIQNLGEQDFIYLDPPYYNTVTPYPNIDHDNLIT